MSSAETEVIYEVETIYEKPSEWMKRLGVAGLSELLGQHIADALGLGLGSSVTVTQQFVGLGLAVTLTVERS